MAILAGQAAIVTGAAQGIGRAVAETLASEGANVLLLDIQDDATTAVAEEIARKYGVQTAYLHTDITVASDVDAMARTCMERFGRIDILVNVAGGALMFGYRRSPLEETSEEQFRRLVEINLHGPFLLTHAVLGQMKKQQYGRILLVSSGAGRGSSRTGIHGYAAAKAGLLGFVRQVARESGAFGVTVNSVAPGLIDSGARVRGMWDNDTDAGRQAFLDGVAVKRLGTPADIAAAILYFVSPQAGYTTGQTLLVDGGHLMF
jgi:3-oxoacyl-[acyl-carrier protein] reductase